MSNSTDLKPTVQPSDKPRYAPPTLIRLDEVATGLGQVECATGSGNAVGCSTGSAATGSGCGAGSAASVS